MTMDLTRFESPPAPDDPGSARERLAYYRKVGRLYRDMGAEAAHQLKKFRKRIQQGRCQPADFATFAEGVEHTINGTMVAAIELATLAASEAENQLLEKN